MLLEAKTRQETLVQMAAKEGEQIKEEMVKEAQKEIQKAALTLAKKILEKAITPQDEERLLKESLKEV